MEQHPDVVHAFLTFCVAVSWTQSYLPSYQTLNAGFFFSLSGHSDCAILSAGVPRAAQSPGCRSSIRSTRLDDARTILPQGHNRTPGQLNPGARADPFPGHALMTRLPFLALTLVNTTAIESSSDRVGPTNQNGLRIIERVPRHTRPSSACAPRHFAQRHRRCGPAFSPRITQRAFARHDDALTGPSSQTTSQRTVVRRIRHSDVCTNSVCHKCQWTVTFLTPSVGRGEAEI